MKTQIECWRALDEGKTLKSMPSGCIYYLKDDTVYRKNGYGSVTKSSLAFSNSKDFRVVDWWESAPDKFWLVRGKYGDVTLIIPHNFTQDILEKITPLTKSEILSYAEHAPE